jgi:acetaldehyde dehydrogenase (acetylating)
MASDDNSSRRVRCAILRSGNIGIDLMAKLMRSHVLELQAMAGIEAGSAGLARAREAGITTCDKGIDGLLALKPLPEIAFDATSANADREHEKIGEALAGFARSLRNL